MIDFGVYTITSFEGVPVNGNSLDRKNLREMERLINGLSKFENPNVEIRL